MSSLRNIIEKSLGSILLVYALTFIALTALWASNYPMQECAQYFLPMEDIESVTNRLQGIISEDSMNDCATKNKVIQISKRPVVHDASLNTILSFLKYEKDIYLEAIERQNGVYIKLFLPDLLNIKECDLLMGDFEDQLLSPINYLKDDTYISLIRVVLLCNRLFPQMFLCFSLAIAILFYIAKDLEYKRKSLFIITFILLPVLIILISLSGICRYKEKDFFPETSRNNFSNVSTDIAILTNLIIRDDTVSSFLDAHPDINIETTDDVYGNSLLMFAISNQRYQAAQALLIHHANPNYVSSYNGGTPLLIALHCLDNHNEPDTAYISLLVHFGADVSLITFDQRHQKERIPLMEAKSQEQAKLLTSINTQME